MAPLFARAEPRRRVWAYLQGLLRAPEDAPRRKHLASYTSEQRADGAQRLLTTARWSAESVREVVVQAVREHTPSGGGLFVTEMAFTKKGIHAVAVDRQFNPDSGSLENCQLALVLLYVTPCGRLLPIDATLYLPATWTGGTARRVRAGIPSEIDYESKSALAVRLLRRGLCAGLEPRWVVASLLCPEAQTLRDYLRDCGVPFLTPVTQAETAALSHSVAAYADHDLLASAASAVCPRPVRQDALVAMPRNSFGRDAAEELERLTALWRDCRERIRFERFEVRSWHGWYRHMVLAMCAQVALELAEDGRSHHGRHRPFRLLEADTTCRQPDLRSHTHPEGRRPPTAACSAGRTTTRTGLAQVR